MLHFLSVTAVGYVVGKAAKVEAGNGDVVVLKSQINFEKAKSRHSRLRKLQLTL